MWDTKMRALFLGMSVATVIGLAAGGAMKPGDNDFTGGPRVDLGASARRAAPTWNEAAAWTSYGGNVPDYVIGTDWVTPAPAVAVAEIETEAEPEPQPRPPEPTPVIKVAHTEEAPPQPPHYPSMGGDTLAGMDSYAPPTPPDDAPPQPPPVN